MGSDAESYVSFVLDIKEENTIIGMLSIILITILTIMSSCMPTTETRKMKGAFLDGNDSKHPQTHDYRKS